MKKYLKLFVFTALISYLLIYFLRPVEMEDIWWHIKTGEWMVQNHQVPYVDTFSPVSPPSAWITNQWLGSCFYYLVSKVAGVNGLRIFRSLFFTTLILLIFLHYHRRRVSITALIPVCLLAALAFDNRAILRPFIFNLIFIHIFLIQLFQHERDKQNWRLFLLSGLGIIWANFHLGSFVYGMILLGIYFLGNLLAISKIANPNERKGTVKTCGTILFAIILYLISLCFTPYGITGVWHAIRVFIDPTYINFYMYANTINEMKPPGYIFTLGGIWFYFLLGFSFWALKRNGALFWRWILWLCVLFLFLYSKRGADFFGIVTVHLILDSFAVKPITTTSQKMFFKILCFAAIIFMFSQIKNSLSQFAVIHTKTIPLFVLQQTPMTPDDLIERIKDSDLKGNIFCPDFWGGYFLWSAYPRFVPIIDGRQANQTIFKEYIYAMSKPEVYWTDFTNKYNLHLAFIDMGDSNYHPLVKFLMSTKNWKLIDVQGSTILLSDQLITKNYSTSSQLTSQDVATLENLGRIATHNTAFHDFLFPPPFYVDFVVESSILYDLGYKHDAITRLKTVVNFENERIKQEVARIGNLMLNDYKKNTSK